MQLRVIEWQERFELGEEVLDKAHRQIFSVFGRITNLLRQRRDEKFACVEGLKYLKSYAGRHFQEEEAYMRKIGYAGYPHHKRLHDEMREQIIPALERELEDADYSPEAVQHFIGVCAGWLSGHIMVEDRAILGQGPGKVTRLVEGSEPAVLREIIAFPMKELFGAEVTVVSQLYTEELLGKSRYYEMTYSLDRVPRLRTILIIEEELLLRLVGELLGLHFDSADELASSAIQELTLILMQHAADHFGEGDARYEMASSRFLTAERCRQSFLEHYPQHSLVVETGGGRIALCMDRLNLPCGNGESPQ